MDSPQFIRAGMHYLVVEGVTVWVFDSRAEAEHAMGKSAERRRELPHIIVLNRRDAERILWEAPFVAAGRWLDEPQSRDYSFAHRGEGVLRAILGPDVRLWSVRPFPPLAAPRGEDTPVIPPDESHDDPTPSDTTWYELRLVDEIGWPLEGVDVQLGDFGRAATTADGRVRCEGAATGVSLARVEGLGRLRELLRSRWEQAREGTWLDEAEDHTYLEYVEPLPMVQVRSKRVHTVVFQPRVLCARIIGSVFDPDKCFVRPGALVHLPSALELSGRKPGAQVLVVGHADATDDSGAGEALALARAESLQAYLTGDIEHWLGGYDEHGPVERCWGPREDHLMLDAVLAPEGSRVTTAPVRYFQATRGLSVDGVFGSQTRGALIGEYMALAGKSPAAAVEFVAHGCGAHFPLEPMEGSTSGHHANGRVELFFFDRSLGVLPSPSGTQSDPGDPAYRQWQQRSIETLTFVVPAEERQFRFSA